MNGHIYFEIQADDLRRAADFYNKIFGWKFEKAQEDIPVEYWRIETGGTAGGEEITIRGTGLLGATAVEFDSDDALSFTVLSDTAEGAAMYAATEFASATERPVEIRIGTPNAWKLWVNGRLLFAREEYHRGMSLDQYRVAAVLREGTNTILLKICQNEQDEDWAQRYQFQLRVCDEAGAAVR
jgi:predicted enzyme related to lactoylglutathione lyase